MKIFDLHNDLPTSGLKHFDSLPHTVVNVFWTTKLENPLDVIYKYIRDNSPTKNRRYAIEDLFFIDNQEKLEAVCNLPLEYVSLTWNHKNKLAGGCSSDGKLTAWGKIVIKNLRKNNILVDTAHLNRKSFFEVAECSDKIFNSHTALDCLVGHERNLTKEQIKIIIEKKGLVGITAVSDFLQRGEFRAKIADYVRHIDCFCQTFSVNDIAIGTDFFGADPILGLNSYNDFVAVKYELKKLGYKHSDIKKIFYTNAQKFCLQK